MRVGDGEVTVGMKMMSIKIKSMIIAVLACILGAAIAAGFGIFYAKAETAVEGEDDVFELIDARYEADEKFEFSATAEFESGSAAGLVFGADDDGQTYWVFNVDRAANAVKLMYFDYTSGEKVVYVIKSENYVGTKLINDNEGEREYVRSRTANIAKVYLKVVIVPDGDKTYAEFYADGIRRFAYVNGSEEAVKLDLNSVTVDGGDGERTLTYAGGRLGYNCFNARVKFTDENINESSDYNEIFRNQYHFSQYAHWNNDPNGLVYYNGYYHLYFQHNPYGNTWDVMHWGHARSKDLVHWELLPIALVPDRDLSMEGEIDHGIGAMWSGSARVYHKGDSAKIDNEYKWFGEAADKNVGDALGLIGFYTRFDDGGNRHQIVMYSTDGGLSWNKRDNIPSTVSRDLDGLPVNGGSWRDPKVFDISGVSGIADGYKWGMALTDMEDNTLFFLKSKNMVEWEHAGCYEVYEPECPDVVSLSDGTKTRTVITFTSRYYVVCDLSYESGEIVMRDNSGAKITSLMPGDPRLKKMDYGVDSYAAQTFYIDGNSDSAYKGKAVAMSWFSGVPNAPESIESGTLQTARKVWNGGGMTIPVVYGLDGETLTTTPITADDSEFAELKTPLVDMYYSPMANGLLDGINSRTAEIIAKLSNPSRTGVAFRVNMSADGSAYTEIGWNRTDGYYVDRTHTEDGGIIFKEPNYALKYASGMGKSNTVLDFYILVDRNNVEVYCDGFTVPFYILTFAAPHSNRMSFTSERDLNILELKVNAIASIWRETDDANEFYVSETSVELDTELSTEQEITVVASEATYEVVSGADVAEVEPSDVGFKIKALAAGEAVVEVKSGTASKLVNVTVYTGAANSDITFESSGIISGKWFVSGDTIIGEQPGGDGFILADESGADYIYSASFDLGTGAAAALVFRATEKDGKLDKYIIANYDNNGKIVKLWSNNRELGRANFTPSDISNITLTAFVEGDRVKVSIDGTEVIDVTLAGDEPKSGRLGLNACATRATFKSVQTVLREYKYEEGVLELGVGGNSRVYKIVNKSFRNSEVPSGFYTLIGNTVLLDEAYFSVLPEAGEYVFTVTGDKFAFDATVDVKAVPEYTVGPVTVNAGSDATVFIGTKTSDYVKVNGKAIASFDYEIKNYTLKINGKALIAGDNTVVLSDGTQFIVSVLGESKETISIYIPPEPLDFKPFAIGMGVTMGMIVLCVIAFVVLIVLESKGKVKLNRPFRDRTAAIKRRNLGLIVAACIAGSVALVFAVCAGTAPLGTAGFVAAAVLTVIFGYPYVAQLVWQGKLYKATLSPVKAMGSPKEIFDVDKDGNKFKVGLRYVGAAFKTLWLGIRILLCAVIALIRAPFLFVGQLKAVTYGEFGFSNKADSIETDETEEQADEAEEQADEAVGGEA